MRCGQRYLSLKQKQPPFFLGFMSEEAVCRVYILLTHRYAALYCNSYNKVFFVKKKIQVTGSCIFIGSCLANGRLGAKTPPGERGNDVKL